MNVQSETQAVGPARAPVISVGNLAFGGRGKTPTVALVAQALLDRGERPAILSRGYGRSDPLDGVVVVSDGRRCLADVARGGDEPMLLSRRVPAAAVLVAEVRAQAAALAEGVFGSTVHVLDDGFQHWSLERDVDIVIVAPDDLVDRRWPLGRLRASPRSLRRAAAVIVEGEVTDRVARRLESLIDRSRVPVFTLSRSLGAARWLEPARLSAPPPAPGARVVAVAGIARPARFAESLSRAGFTVVDGIAFRDHHTFTPRDLERIDAAFRRADAAAVVVTEKDAVRLLSHRPFTVPVAAVALEVAIEPRAEFDSWLSTRLTEARAWKR